MGLFSRSYTVVKYDGDSDLNWLIWKWTQNSFDKPLNNRSKLIVGPGQVCVVVHNGQIKEIIKEGSVDVRTEWLPVTGGLLSSMHSSNPYPVEFYFINQRLKMDFLWGTSSALDIRDPKLGIILQLRVRGQFGLRITDYAYLIDQLAGSFGSDSIIKFTFVSKMLIGQINQTIKNVLAKFIIENQITYTDLYLNLDKFANYFAESLADYVKKLGMEIATSSIEAINIPDAQRNQINQILIKKSEFDILGENYRTVKGYDIYSEAAKNPNGSAGLLMGANIGAQLGQNTPTLIPNNNKTQQMECVKCQSQLKVNAKFCAECGHKVLQNCLNCNSKLEANSKFCLECGQKVE